MKKLLMIAIVMIAACDRHEDMPSRTFELNRLSNDEAIALVTPYIREGGYVSGKNKLITVREKEDRLKVIEDLLKKYDGLGDAADVVLRVRVIEANGFTARDTAIADIESTLRETFRYRGYRLAGETRIQAREQSSFAQTLGNGYTLDGGVGSIRVLENEQRVPVTVELAGQLDTQPVVAPGVMMKTTVTATMGKPVVLGQSTKNGAVILVITPSLVTQ